MADRTTGILSSAGGALTASAIHAGLPLAIGFFLAGILGSLVGFLRSTLAAEKEGKRWLDLPIRCHLFNLFRGLVFAEFVCCVLWLAWTELGWPWTWGLIVGCISAVFAPDAIDLMWAKMKKLFEAWNPK